MILKRSFLLCAFAGIFLTGCNSDDEVVEEVIPRDPVEQAAEDEETLQAFLQTHFYNYEEFENPPAGFDYVIKFDTIAGENSNKTPIIESDLLYVKNVAHEDIDYKMYILKVREGVGRQLTYADSAYAAYRGVLTNRVVFDNNTVVPTWFDLPGYLTRDGQGRIVQTGGNYVQGFTPGLTEFREGSGFKVNPDNTVKWNDDYGVGAMFLPSGLGYYASAVGSIPPYSPIIFSFKLYRAVEADHDNDGIPSWMEDLDEDGDLYNDNTDGNGFPNFSDSDDDGDGTPTRREIIIKEDGTIEFPDSNNNGTPNYLDPDYFEEVS